MQICETFQFECFTLSQATPHPNIHHYGKIQFYCDDKLIMPSACKIGIDDWHSRYSLQHLKWNIDKTYDHTSTVNTQNSEHWT